MKIAVYGPGPIGSTFAFQLSLAKHDVTVIARNKRLEALQAEGAIATADGRRAPVTVSGTLDPSIAYDLVLVTVLAHQVEAIMPALKASAAKQVMFMFNTFESIEPLREAVGAKRFAFGFPAIAATLTDGKLRASVFTRGQITLSTDAEWAKVFTEAGIKTLVHDDIQSWLRTHAVLIASLTALLIPAHARGSGATWAESTRAALAMKEGMAVVKHLGNAVTPTEIGMLSGLPTPMLASVLWGVSRVKSIRDIVAVGPAEPRNLIDAMVRLAPNETKLMQAIRP